MTHSKTITRPDGVKWLIVVTGTKERMYAITYRVENGINILTNSHPFTADEINAVKLECWQKMKPTI